MTKNQNIFMLGIGGISMSGIACYLQDMGYTVCGSDMNQNDETAQLQARGIKVYSQQETTALMQADLIIYSSAIHTDHPQFKLAQQLNKPMIRRAEVLSQLARQGTQLALAGAHGKTTTTTMCAWLLQQAKLNPTAFIGGQSVNFDSNIVHGSPPWFVLEADEYDRSFLALDPIYLGITAIEADHLDIYQDLNDLFDTFKKLVSRLPFYGQLVVNYHDQLAMQAATDAPCPVVTCGFDKNANLYAANLQQHDFTQSFDLYQNGHLLGPVSLNAPGRFNVLNALIAFGVAQNAGVSFAHAQQAFSTYLGVKRRFEYLGTHKDVLFYDDYAHHPSEIEATLTAVKQASNRRIVVVFEPHLYTRTRDFYKGFAQSLSLADEVHLLPIYPAREEPLKDVSTALIYNELEKNNFKGKKNLLKRKQDIFLALDESLKPGDILITLGAGTVTAVGRDFLKKVRA